MHQAYDDIRSRIAEAPAWWDEVGVPRYGAFSPRALADIYAEEAALAEVTCQGCGRAFAVAFSLNPYERFAARDGRTLADLIRARELHYGDPPNVGCCPAGPTMNSEPRRVLEYWRRDGERLGLDWIRDPTLEVGIEPAWVRGDAGGGSGGDGEASGDG